MMDAESRIKTMAERYGWPDDVVQDVRTLVAVESNAAFDHGRRVEREAWIRSGADAVRKIEAPHDD